MKLYTIRAYNNKDDETPDRTYIITAKVQKRLGAVPDFGE